jgi:hypothetical protein
MMMPAAKLLSWVEAQPNRRGKEEPFCARCDAILAADAIWNWRYSPTEATREVGTSTDEQAVFPNGGGTSPRANSRSLIFPKSSGFFRSAPSSSTGRTFLSGWTPQLIVARAVDLMPEDLPALVLPVGTVRLSAR